MFLDLVTHLRDDRTLRALRDVIPALSALGGTIVVIDHQPDLPTVLTAESVKFELSLPERAELEEIFRDVLKSHHREKPLTIDIRRGVFDAMIRNLRGLHRRQVRRIVSEAVAGDRRLDENDLATILVRKRQMIHSGGLLEFIDTPVTLQEVAGMKRLKQWLAIRASVMTPDDQPCSLETPRGILMLGVQGAGKSFCAKAIAAAWQWPLLRLDVGALYDKYIGESERRLRDALQQAEAMAPIILWIDEIEKGFSSAASRSTDGGLSQRMFGELLTWMQEHRAPVFLVATANDIEALPPELLRKGRFDEIFFVDLPSNDVRRELFTIHLNKRCLVPSSFDLDRLVTASKGYSGAEIEQAIIAARYCADAEKRAAGTDDVFAALTDSPPLSVTMSERVAALRAWAKGRCMPAD